MSLRMKLQLCSLLAVLAGTGCAARFAMTPDIVQQDGRMVFEASKEKVFKAVQDSLESMNVGVAVAKPDSGLIVSKRFTIASYAQRGTYVATMNEDTIQYDITVKETDKGTEVTCSPRGFHNAVEVTDRQVWQLDGDYGQRPRWQKLFAEIKRML